MNRRRTVAAIIATVIPVAAWSAADFTYDTAQVGYYTIHPMSFAPDGAPGSGGYFNSWNRGRLAPDSTAQQCLNAGVNLPTGAVLQEVVVWFRSDGVELYAPLIRTDLATGRGVKIGGGAFNDASGERVSRARSVSASVATIDNVKYAYGFGACIRAGTTFDGARIKYTYRSAGD